MALAIVTGEFRVAADPELRFTPSGKAVANVRLVNNSRKKNEADEWVDDKVCWLNASIWDQPAENLVESVTKGDLVEVRGRLHTREYEVDGEKRVALELMLDAIAPSLRYATAKVAKTERRAATTATGGTAAPAPEDPWATTAQGEEPPF